MQSSNNTDSSLKSKNPIFKFLDSLELSFRVWSDFGELWFCRYNFDIVSDNPLPGRYEWVKVVP